MSQRTPRRYIGRFVPEEPETVPEVAPPAITQTSAIGSKKCPVGDLESPTGSPPWLKEIEAIKAALRDKLRDQSSVLSSPLYGNLDRKFWKDQYESAGSANPYSNPWADAFNRSPVAPTAAGPVTLRWDAYRHIVLHAAELQTSRFGVSQNMVSLVFRGLGGPTEVIEGLVDDRAPALRGSLVVRTLTGGVWEIRDVFLEKADPVLGTGIMGSIGLVKYAEFTAREADVSLV